MFADNQLNLFLLNEDFWYIFGIGLIILDIAIGLEFFALAFGLGALLTGMILNFSIAEGWISYWEQTLLLFSVLTLISLFLLRRFVPKGRQGRDINDY